ncbi:MAG: hypothetical protein GT597_13645 [Bacteroidales bacterium]|jgi:hypothetical protein|nr:hypothetical protein [Bacteroidales bacterium]MZP67183.1 hypothetical protein [Bacteroidales bacterium]
MKKLGKLQINPERLIKNEELISLKGGSNCWCFHEENGGGGVCITGAASSADECKFMCEAIGCYGSFTPY